MQPCNWLLTGLIFASVCAATPRAAAELPDGTVVIEIKSRQLPPQWALTQRLLLAENVRSANTYFHKYWDERGYLKCIERWGWNDGSDDVLQGCANFPLLYALGGERSLLENYYKAFEGAIKQFTTEEVESAPEYGVFYKEFLTANDWHHHGESLAAFNQLPLAETTNKKYRDRALRFAGFYLNEGIEGEPIYDPKHRIIRSLMTGSKGAQLSIKPRFWGDRIGSEWPLHINVKGDAPLNLYATTLPANAFVLTGDEKYRKWLLEYVDAWIERAIENNGHFPGNIGLNGIIGEHWGGRWWPSALGGWSHKPKGEHGSFGFFVPAILSALDNAMILSSDTKYMEPLRRQIRALYDVAIEHDGKKYPPAGREDDGWVGRMGFTRQLIALYLAEFRDDDLKLLEDELELWGRTGKFRYDTGYFYIPDGLAWFYYVLGRNPDYPEKMMESDLNRIHQRMRDMGRDKTPEWQCRTDWPHRYNPLSTHALYTMICGGVSPSLGKGTSLLRAELWHFDPQRNRPGLPENIAVLIDSITKDKVSVRYVNLCQSESRSVVVRTGAYGENQCVEVRLGGRRLAVDNNYFAVDLAPGSGGRIVLKVKRFVNQPRAGLSWTK